MWFYLDLKSGQMQTATCAPTDFETAPGGPRQATARYTGPVTMTTATKTYEGTKRVHARPMNRGEYNAYRGWEMSADENPADDGYLVEYLDGGKSNHPGHAGYISWSPKDVFERAYCEVGQGMPFGDALKALKAGQRVARAGWNGKGMWLWIPEPLDEFCTKVFACGDAAFEAAPWIGMKTADNKFVPWLASQTDVLAEDWDVLT